MVLFILGLVSISSTALSDLSKSAAVLFWFSACCVWANTQWQVPRTLKLFMDGSAHCHEQLHPVAKGKISGQAFFSGWLCVVDVQFFWGKEGFIVLRSRQDEDQYRRLLVFLRMKTHVHNG